MYKNCYSVLYIAISDSTLKCHQDQILDIHLFTFSYTIGLSKLSCQISIYYEQYNARFLDL